MTTANATNLSGYRLLEVLYQSSRTQVYRAIREADQHSVIVKVLSNPHPSFNELLQFRNQYTIGQHLNHPGIGSITELLPWKNGQALIMADSGEISLADYLAASPTGLPLTEVLEIGRQMADILHYLSQQRVIHKDIKPANILIHPESRQIKLIDFSISSLLPKETQTIQNPTTLEGTLAYIAPEQTGRMNRGIDYRADFYTLGVTLYQLLTGKLPFESEDPLELVHCHLAKDPPPIQSWCPDVPHAVSAIVAKLMAKIAEERYQSATGLKADLEACLHQWQTTGTVKHFALGQLDEIAQFNIPQRLYGREQPVQQLLAAFDRVCQGEFEVVVVKGYSGVGKTALVQELLGRVTERRGYFAAGKCDQLQRNAPLAAPVQTLRQSVLQMLTESEARLVYWRDRFLSALGENVRLIVDAIPELEHIVGSQPEVPPLEGAAAAMRFGETFNQFVQCLSGPDHPYVGFLDDFQWADSASFEIFPHFTTDPRNGYFLSVLAYRDNEVGPTHPLVHMVETIRQAGVRITEIHLKPLGRNDVAQLVADTLHRQPNLVLPLADVLFQKTEGNPFFLTQLLTSLHSDRLVWFETESKQWQWDLDAIQRANLTDNVVDLMVGRLSQLPKAARRLLSLSACIGNRFYLHTLAIIAEQIPTQVAQGLLPALQAGFVAPLGETYKDFLSADLPEFASDLDARNCGYQFAHDRVQQAAYALIPAEQVEQTHYRIVQLLLQESDITPTGKALMELVGHINAAQSCLNTVAEREAAARINLLAGQQAQASAAFAAAYDFYQTGLTLLRDTSWQTTYDLTRDLHHAAAKAACLAANHAETERLVEISLTYSRSKLDRAAAYQLRVQSLKFQSNYRQAIALGLQALAELGIDLPEQPTPDHLTALSQQTAQAWGDRTIEDLINLPMMVDPTAMMTIELLQDLLAAAYLGNPALFPLIAEQQLYLVLTHGLCPAAALTCMAKAVGICVFQQDWPTGIRFAQTALAILNKLNVKQDQGIVTYAANAFVLIFSQPLQQVAQSAQRNIAVSLEIGDFENATHEAFNYACYTSCLETPLAELEQTIGSYYNQLAPLQQVHPLMLIQLRWQSLRRLLNLSATPTELSPISYDRDPASPNFNEQILAYGELQELMFTYCLGDIVAALEHAEVARPCIQSHGGQLNAILFSLYDALAALANYADCELAQQKAVLERVEQHYQYLHQCAQQAPMNYQHKVDLIAAERYRVLGNHYKALDAYDQSIAGATEQGFWQEAALANERAAEFYEALGKPKVARVYLDEAYQFYQRWGAIAKLDQLAARYPWLVQTAPPAVDPTTLQKSSSTLGEQLDLDTFVKAAKTLSSEIDLDRLLEKLLQLILENAAAQKGCIVLQRGAEWVVEVIDVDAEAQLVEQRGVAVAASAEVPQSLILYVARTGKPQMIADALKEPTLQTDPYVQQTQPRSLLCLPMCHQGQTVGIIYLENNSATDAFTPRRIEVLNLLASQAVIALQNARLYQQSQNSQRQMKTVLSSMPGMAYSCLNDEYWTMQYVSDGCLDLTGYSPAEMLHNNSINYAELIHPDDEAMTVAAVEAGLQTHRPYRLTYRIYTRDGQEKWVWEQGQALRDKNGEIILLEGFITDISDRKQAEQALQQSEAQLRQQAQSLEQAIQELQTAQMQMIQSEKMSALGNLVAGVAHEINNPVGFLKGNIKPAQEYVSDLLGLIDLLIEKTPQLDEDIEDEIETIDLDFIRKDLPELLDSMNLGVERIRSISTSLRTFSRADKDYKTEFNLHDGIDSTILILKHRLKANEQRPAIEVVKDYGNLPKVLCFPGQLNQVFMNILANAIDMFDEATEHSSFAQLQKNPQAITIKTQALTDNQLEIRISDNGKGMDEGVKAQIFDHLYTTKRVGKGTGLGLAIARQIVEEKHGGTITVESQPGKGAEFVLTLPIR